MLANLLATANDLTAVDISWSDGPGYLAAFLVVSVGLSMILMTPTSCQSKSDCGKCK